MIRSPDAVGCAGWARDRGARAWRCGSRRRAATEQRLRERNRRDGAPVLGSRQSRNCDGGGGRPHRLLGHHAGEDGLVRVHACGGDPHQSHPYERRHRCALRQPVHRDQGRASDGRVRNRQPLRLAQGRSPRRHDVLRHARKPGRARCSPALPPSRADRAGDERRGRDRHDGRSASVRPDRGRPAPHTGAERSVVWRRMDSLVRLHGPEPDARRGRDPDAERGADRRLRGRAVGRLTGALQLPQLSVDPAL